MVICIRHSYLPFLADRLVMADNFRNDKIEEFLREVGIELGGLREASQARDLRRLARRIGGSETVRRLVTADRLGAFEALGQHVDERGVDIVDAVAQAQQFGMVHGRPQMSVPKS